MDYRGMIVGDWLLDKEEGFSRRVAQVTSDVFEGCAPGVILENGMDYQECEPIPLTPEILEKNGFEHRHAGEPIKRQYWILRYDGGNVKAKINRGLLYFEITGVSAKAGYFAPCFHGHIEYVHQLQHALRLCGITHEISL